MDSRSPAVIVCTMGNPVVVVTTFLEQLARQQVQLHYHGDFDWPGISIANRVMGSFGASPWRMGAGDYEAALAAVGRRITDLPLLEGPESETPWDPSLCESMLRHGRGVHEEMVIETLLTDVM